MNLEQQKRATSETVKALVKEVYRLEHDRKNLNEDIDNLELYLAELKRKRDEISQNGYSGEQGLLPTARRRLKYESDKLERLGLPKATWKDNSAPYNTSDYVIQKITAKRIYITNIESGESTYYDKDSGTSNNSLLILDVGACLEIWEKYLKTK